MGLTLSGIVNQGVILLTGGLWPQIARGWDNGERDAVMTLSSLATKVLTLAVGLASGFVICFAPYLVAVLFGDSFRQSSNLVAVLAVGPLGLASGSANLVLRAATNGRFARNASLVGGGVLFGAAFALVPLFGGVGAAVARSATQVFIGAVTLAWAGRVAGHESRTRQDLRLFLLLVALTVALVILVTLELTLKVTGRALLFGVYCCVIGLLFSPLRDPDVFRQLRSLMAGRA